MDGIVENRVKIAKINMKEYMFKLQYSVLFLFIIISCSEQNIESEPCAITIDSVSIIDTRKVGDISYYLVHRISGWNDKTEILELYDSKPEFDHCSKANIKPIFGDSLELTLPVRHVFFNTKEKLLEIEYKEEREGKIDNSHLKIEFR
jgi:hypothetical protein